MRQPPSAWESERQARPRPPPAGRGRRRRRWAQSATPGSPGTPAGRRRCV